MKKTLIILLILIAVIYSGNLFWTKTLKGSGILKNKSVNVSSFHKIEIEGPFDITLTKNTQPNISIQADDNIIEGIKIKKEDTSLRIKLTKPRGYNQIEPSNPIKIKIATPQIQDISIKGAAQLNSTSNWTFNTINLNVKGSGDINLLLSGKTLNVTISGSGDINLSGSVQNQNLNVAGSPQYDAKNLISQSSTITISGSAKALLNVKKSLNVMISGSGLVLYKGDPEIQSKIMGSGTIKKL